MKVKVHGVFVVTKIGEEFVEMDPYLQGSKETADQFKENGYKEVTAKGTVKEFDGFQVGDFFSLSGEFEVIRSNEIFSKIMIDGQMISLPNHKLMGVE